MCVRDKNRSNIVDVFNDFNKVEIEFGGNCG